MQCAEGKGGSLRKRLVYGLIRKSIIKERSEGDGGDERETLKELECFVPAQPASNTFNNETGNKTHWHTHSHTHTHANMYHSHWEDVFSYVFFQTLLTLK